MREIYDGLTGATVGVEEVPGVSTLKYKEMGPSLATLFLFNIFLSAASYTFARVSLHFLTMRGSTLCMCCSPILRKFAVKFLRFGAPIFLNSLMIVNTRLVWNEGGKPSAVGSDFYPGDTPSNVYGYSVGFSHVELIFLSINMILMMVFILILLFMMALNRLIILLIRICCKKRLGAFLIRVPRSTCPPAMVPVSSPPHPWSHLSERLFMAARPQPPHH